MARRGLLELQLYFVVCKQSKCNGKVKAESRCDFSPEVGKEVLACQELMDAGRVQFVSGANINLNLANGFKNTDIYCVTLTHTGATTDQQFGGIFRACDCGFKHFSFPYPG